MTMSDDVREDLQASVRRLEAVAERGAASDSVPQKLIGQAIETVLAALSSEAALRARVEELEKGLRKIACVRPHGPIPALVKGALIEDIERIALAMLHFPYPVWGATNARH